MYKILVLNETGCEDFSREYNTFVSALCLARMGHDVLYVGNTRFAHEFYQGGHTHDVDIFDLEMPETPAMLPVGFEVLSVPRMNAGLTTDSWLKGRIDAFGKTDIVFYSGNEYMATFGQQVANYKDGCACSLDWDDMPACVNEVQLRRSRGSNSPSVTRVLCFKEHAWEQEIANIRNICESLDRYELWIVARYGNLAEIPHDRLQQEDVYWQPPLTDSGRFQLLRSATFYVEPSRKATGQGIVEAACCGVPVIAQCSKETMMDFGSLVSYYSAIPPSDQRDKWDLVEKQRIAQKFYGFAQRIEYLHNMIKSLEC